LLAKGGKSGVVPQDAQRQPQFSKEDTKSTKGTRRVVGWVEPFECPQDRLRDTHQFTEKLKTESL